MYGGPSGQSSSASSAASSAAQAPIVDKPLPDPQASAAPEKKLPYSAEQLRQALHQKNMQQTAASLPETPAPSTTSADIPEEDFTFDMEAFEEAVDAIHSSSEPAPSSRTPTTGAKPVSKPATPVKGFFTEFSKYLEGNKPSQIDPAKIEGDMLHHMRLYHERQHDGEETFLHHADLATSVRRRLRELQSLEDEWYARFSESKDVERAMVGLEGEIDEKVIALRKLLKLSRNIALLSEDVPEEQAFILNDGEKLRSLSALRHALIRMSPAAFSTHVREGKNDFAEWVQSVFKDVPLADKLRAEPWRESMIRVLKEYTMERLRS